MPGRRRPAAPPPEERDHKTLGTRPPAPGQRRILVIKLSALGDFVQALGPCAAIRDYHPDDHITLLTTPPFVDLAEASPYFDAVEIDTRPKIWELKALKRLIRLLNQNFDRVYDLQTSDRSSRYFQLMGGPKGGPEWSGIAKGCSHPHTNPRRDKMHTIERQASQLAMAGIFEVGLPDLSWIQSDVGRLGLPERYALLVPGGAPHRPEKRWPAQFYGEIGRWLVERGVTPVILGTKSEQPEAWVIEAICPEAVNLLEKTSLFDIAPLARGAALAVGNDTGPMHLIALSDCPSVVVYSYASDPALCGQRGAAVKILRQPIAADVRLSEVREAIGEVAGLG
ncbi:glycosyltransferase family 9 protein [Roseospirillum parvum]|uniref:ADP-heptose:LPS heptosyltransferase n=1 Tax=Roseospirillum parvum TaxID=83401 RepID=A0A1G7ZJ57_9PROT|nr:glycosyltransferase family 9 protein [Roseospirillum parvum]SDH08586.1 ADP-heptose:LPS heptosyltransferase [Roseospirillum parvum]